MLFLLDFHSTEQIPKGLRGVDKNADQLCLKQLRYIIPQVNIIFSISQVITSKPQDGGQGQANNEIHLPVGK
jgi:hypothetical protein